MPNIYVDQLNFEYEESGSYHDILANSALGTQLIGEQRISVAHIYVDIVNLQIPVSETVGEILTNSELATHTIEEVITGTPAPEPEVVVGGGAGSRIRVMGGRPWSEEDIYVTNNAEQLIGEEIFVGDILETYAYNSTDIDTRIRRPIYAKTRSIQVLSFRPDTERKVILPVEAPLEEPKINHRQKDEEELLLLGII